MRVQAGEEVERILTGRRRSANAHEEETGKAPTLDPDFAADAEEIIRNCKPWNPRLWD
jgi:hypothetical protein